MLSEQNIPLLMYLDGKLEKYVEQSIVESYVEFMRSRTRAKVIASEEAAVRVVSLSTKCAAVKTTLQKKEKRLWKSESECAALQKSLAAEKELWKTLEKVCGSLGSDIETTQKATIDLQERLEASRMAFNKDSRRVDELTADLAKRDQSHAAELAAKAKELAECEAVRSSELDKREKLEANCNEMQQRSAVEKQLIVIEAKLLEVEEKNQLLTSQTDEALTKKLARKLDLFLFSLEEMKKNLALEVLTVLRRIEVERNSAGVATTGSAGVAPVDSLNQSE
ncbi:hypothetical protein AXG93_838s1050 [Marchantia polymorpha subsp. ruderalis]|uniref:Uncharacterized protein n=1 Tax=Marchantia polymorpha subsp. ruderalis TaxID=1480154 RepID=A0A176WSD6_MARPO|nr:hypothetical protein AXG93_838s1050 [Marchantia polymorpha subsp. ruderalis]